MKLRLSKNGVHSMRNVFFYTIGIGFASGIFIRSFFDMGMGEVYVLLIIGFSCFVVWKYMTVRPRYESPLFLGGLICVFVSLGMWRMAAEERVLSPLSVYEDEEVVVIGTITREPEIRDATIQLYVAPLGIPSASSERVLVMTDKFVPDASHLSHGDIVRVEGTLSLPEAFAADGGRTFDYPGYLKARGVTYAMYFAHVTVEKEEEGTFFGGLFRGKEAFMNVLENHIPEPHAGLSQGLLLGVKRALGDDLEATFRETGIIHIVVLSGYNVMIVVECIMYVLSFLFKPRTRMVFGITGIALFALLVGLSATVVRASIMAGLLVIARATGRIYAVIRALVLAGVVMLILNPYLLVHDPGFQLSFLATLGLILVSPHIEKHLMMIPTMLGMRGIVTATLATQIFVLPLILYHMGLLSVVSVFVNALVLPMVPIAMFLTFITGIIGAVSPILGTGIGYSAYLSLEYIIVIAEFFGSLSFASYVIGSFPFWVVCVTYFVFAIVLVYLEQREKEYMFVKQTMKADTNEYEGWIIEEEKHTSRGVQSTPRDVKGFPF